MKMVLLLWATACLAGVSAVAFAPASAQSGAPSRSSAKPEPAGEPAARARGHAIFHNRCEICHFSDSTAEKIGPGLKGLYRRGKFADSTKVDDASLEKWIQNGSKNMPPFKGVITQAQMKDLIAYLKGI